MTRRLLGSYLALTLLVLLALEVPLAIANGRNERQDLTTKVERDAYAAASLAEDALQFGKQAPELQTVAARYRRQTGGRMVIVNRRGVSIADSHPTTPGERNFASRPEIASALGGTVATGIRPSETLHTNLLYVAVPVASSGVVFGAVRITYPTSTLDRRINRYRLALVVVGLAVLAAAAVVGTLLARSFARPLEQLESVATRIGAGDLTVRAQEGSGPPEVRRLAGEINRTTVKLGALLTAQEQFVADASHELRTPLTALRLRLETGDADAALVEVERLTRLVDELLALARADATSEPREAVALDEVVAERIAFWAPFAAERHVEIAQKGEGSVVTVGRARIGEVVDNLLANAVDASPPGSTVTVALDGACVHVLDEGPGLSPEQRDRAFDRFWRASSKPGSGLGLPIARRLVEADGGTIALAEAPSGGVDAVVRYAAPGSLQPSRR